MVSVEAFYDLGRLFSFREILDGLDPEAPPQARIISRPNQEPGRLVGILPGSFNPLTNAHVELASTARVVLGLQEVFFTLSKVTVDKEVAGGACPEDRLLLLFLFASRHPGLGVAVVNRGLYFEQAQAFRSLWGGAVDIDFLVGSDKVAQLFATSYYSDRDSALSTLFAASRLIVAHRGAVDRRDLDSLLCSPECRSYREKVRCLELSANVKNLSSTTVRESASRGLLAKADVPQEVHAFLEETLLYRPPYQVEGQEVDPYGFRVRLLDILYPLRPWAETEANFPGLMTTALSQGKKGRALRSLLSQRPHQRDIISQLHALQSSPE